MTKPKHECVADTGAKVGDTVKCVGHRDASERYYFTEGRKYKVKNFGTQLCVDPNSNEHRPHIPRVGYGAYWELSQ